MLKRMTVLAVVLLMLCAACSGGDTPAATETTTAAATAATATSAGPAETPTEAATEAATEASDETSAGGAGLELPPPGTLPLVTEPVTFTIGIPQSPLTTDYENNYTTLYLEETTGIDLQFELFSTEALQQFALMVSAGQTLPDIMLMGFGDLDRLSYGTSGAFLPLNDYFASDAYFFDEALDKWASPQEKEDIFKYGTSPDGNLYAFPCYYVDPGDASALGCWINRQWLDNLGLAVPTTTDEFYNVLAAFRDNDANGNGDPNDEIPYVGHAEWVGSAATYLMNSFLYDGFNADGGNQFTVEDGRLVAPFVQDAWREGVRYIRKLSDEGLLSPLSFSQTSNELRAILSDPSDAPSIIGAFTGHPSPLFGSEGVPRVMEYQALPPLTGPTGVAYTPNVGWFANYVGQITSSCQYPELAFRFLDACAREDISLTARNGEQGVHWEYTTEGSPNHVLPGYEVVFRQMVSEDMPARWTSENDTIWHANVLGQMPPRLMGGLAVPEYPNEYRQYQMRTLWYESVPLRFDKHPDVIAPRIILNQAEIDDITEMRTSLQTYVAECRTQFILGGMDVENDWDAYLTQLDGIGLPHILEVLQQAFDRMNAA